MKSKKPAPVSRSLATFRASHDPTVIIPTKIKAALEKLRIDGGDEAYAYEYTDATGGVPFSKLAGVGSIHLNQYREQFKDFLVEVRQDTGSKRAPRWVWFATAKAAKAARAA